jgi:hypothetical protein|tara:strand:+ start:697 stop:1386 length:690 start_codon:yes stop_codon:yes gene_type:complete
MVSINTISLCGWDCKPLLVLSTFPPYADICKINSKTALGGWTEGVVRRPTVVSEYNKDMGGTDMHDQYAQYYDDRRRTKKWQHRIFGDFLHSACINAMILYNSKAAKQLRLLHFQSSVMQALCNAGEEHEQVETDNSDDEEEERPVKVTKGTKKKDWILEFDKRHKGTHCPESVTNRDRKVCIVCSTKIPWRCSNCDVFVCFGPKPCWERFHTQPNPFNEARRKPSGCT